MDNKDNFEEMTLPALMKIAIYNDKAKQFILDNYKERPNLAMHKAIAKLDDDELKPLQVLRMKFARDIIEHLDDFENLPSIREMKIIIQQISEWADEDIKTLSPPSILE